jgi:hypothetical protein
MRELLFDGSIAMWKSRASRRHCWSISLHTIEHIKRQLVTRYSATEFIQLDHIRHFVAVTNVPTIEIQHIIA